MKLLIITQSVDKNYVPLCFFEGWLREFGKQCEKVTVIAQQRGEYDLPENVNVLTLKKEDGLARPLQIFRALGLMWKHRKEYEAVFVHMTPIWIVIGAPLWILLRRRMYLWYEIKTARWPLKLAVHLVKKVFSASTGGMPLKTKRSVLTGHGIDIETFKLTDEQRDPHQIITVGRITGAKRLDLILRGFASLPQEYKMSVIGVTITDDDRNVIASLKEQVEKNGLHERVTFGTVPDEDLVRLLNQASLFMHASERTSLDKAPLQAMACGCMIVSSSDVVQPFLPEACKANPDELGTRAAELLALSVDEQERLRNELRESVVSNHSLPSLIERLVGEMKI